MNKGEKAKILAPKETYIFEEETWPFSCPFVLQKNLIKITKILI